MNTPNLRFKGVNNEWKQCNLTDILNLFGGNAFSSKDTSKEGVKWLKIANVSFGKINWEVTDYLPSNFLEKYPNYSLTSGDLVLTLTRPILNRELKIAQITTSDLPALLNQRVAKLIINEEIVDKKFIFHLLRNRKTVLDIERSISGTDPPNLGNNELKKIKVFIPSNIESKKVASFFDTIDKKLQFQQEKIYLLKEQKKGYMQKIFSQELRFKDENGKRFPTWETNKLSNYLFEHKVRNYEEIYSKQDVLSVSGDYGIVNQIEFQGRSFAGDSVANYHVVHKGDIVYTKSPLRSNPYGIIKCNKEVAGIVSTLYAVYSCKENILGEFVDYYFQLGDHTNSYLRPLVNKGAKNDMKINNENVLKGEITIPLIKEQRKIIQFLSTLDKKINLEQAKYKELVEEKKYFMQQMFI
jgi:type I restriction enzyme, S subunit